MYRRACLVFFVFCVFCVWVYTGKTDPLNKASGKAVLNELIYPSLCLSSYSPIRCTRYMRSMRNLETWKEFCDV